MLILSLVIEGQLQKIHSSHFVMVVRQLVVINNPTILIIFKESKLMAFFFKKLWARVESSMDVDRRHIVEGNFAHC